MFRLLAAFAAGLHAVIFMVAPTHAQAGPPAPPHARSIPGITAPDPFPNGCVDCHTVYPDRNLDVRLSTLLERWTVGVDSQLLGFARAAASRGQPIVGRHPEVTNALASIPDGCLKCHGRASETAPPFAALLHAVHFSGAERNHFISVFQGECTHCHKLEQATGRWSVPSRPELPRATDGQRDGARTGPPSSR